MIRRNVVFVVAGLPVLELGLVGLLFVIKSRWLLVPIEALPFAAGVYLAWPEAVRQFRREQDFARRRLEAKGKPPADRDKTPPD